MTYRPSNRKLTDEQAAEVLRVRPDKIEVGPLAKRLAEEHGCAPCTIINIWKRRSYAHVKRPTE